MRSITPLTFAALQHLAEDNYQRDLLEYNRQQPRYSLRSARPEIRRRHSDIESFSTGSRDPEALRRFARTGGPDMSDVKGFDPNRRQRELRRKEPLLVVLTENTPIGRTSAHTDPELFMANLAGQEILLQETDPSDDISVQQLALRNYAEIMDALTAPRDMSDLSLEDCRRAMKRIRDFPREKPFFKGMMPILCGPPDPTALELAKSKGWILLAPSGPLTIYDEEILFSEAPKMSAFSDTDARADHLWGSHPSLIHLSIREDLGHILTPASKQRTDSPGAINLVIEAKGKGGNMLTLAAQALIAGAITARAMLELRQWKSTTGRQGTGLATRAT